ncbi:MAG: hypothetical protein AAFY46_07685, partial [Planctomycetota bacterium]
APKSNAAYVAIDEAMKDVREGRTLPVPVHLRDPNTSPTAGDDGAGVKMRDRREGDASARYRYSHNYDGGVTGQDYLGVERTYYEPRDSGAEAAMAERLRAIKKLRDSKRRDD